LQIRLLTPTERDTLRLVNFADRAHVGCVRISAANSIAHERAKLDLCKDLLTNNHLYLTEARGKGWRVDVLDLSDGVAYEIVCSESEESIARKESVYPFRIFVVKTNAGLRKL
jgi:hypothetical protein